MSRVAIDRNSKEEIWNEFSRKYNSLAELLEQNHINVSMLSEVVQLAKMI